MNFTAIDFETANEKGYPCALGLAIVENGLIVERRSWLIRPYELNIPAFYTSIHGISEADVENEPEFSDLWFILRSYLDGQNIVAHNAPFDVSVLKGALDLYEIPYPEFNYACTVSIARQVWPRPTVVNHKLNTMAAHLGVEFKHHDASDDAYAASAIVLEAAKKTKAESFETLLTRLGMRPSDFAKTAQPLKPFRKRPQAPRL